MYCSNPSFRPTYQFFVCLIFLPGFLILSRGLAIADGVIKPNADPVYQSLRQMAQSPTAFSGRVARVNNLVLKRDLAIFTLRSGEIYFAAPIEGRTIAAVFIGDGDVKLEPPTEIEQKQLAIFTGQPAYTDQFSRLVLRFSDKTFDEIKDSPQCTMTESGAQGSRALDLYKENQTLLRKELRTNMELRTLEDIYAPERPGFFYASIDGKRFSKLFYLIDPKGITSVYPEQVALMSYGESDFGTWTAFHLAAEYGKGTARNSQDRRTYDIEHHALSVSIRDTRLSAIDKIKIKALASGVRVLPFDLLPTLRATRVSDDAGNELNFIQEDKDQDADFGIILQTGTEAGKEFNITIEYQGADAILDLGSGNFALSPRARSTWYPNNPSTAFGDRAAFDITYRYPKKNMLVGTGKLVGEEGQDGDLALSKWTSDNLELAVAGFNYGKFKKKSLVDKDTGYTIEFYANEEVPQQLRELQIALERLESSGVSTDTTLGSITTTKMADTAIVQAQNSVRIYNAFFGKLPFERFALSQQPFGSFGQAWPTLIYMPYTAFIDTTQRVQLFGISGGTDTFWKYVEPHELAHQWWGHIVGWNSYHDQWMSEGFSEFSASLYVQYVIKDPNKVTQFWEDQRKLIIQSSPATKGLKPYTVGPVSQGYRLQSGKTGAVPRNLIYPKGAYILHMLRMMMYDNKTHDQRFSAMMNNFIKTHYNKDISNDDFKEIVDKHMTPGMDLGANGKMDWFFNQWVYGTEIPVYRFEYTIGSADGKTVLSGKLNQSGVSDDFQSIVPLYLDFGNGWQKIGSINIRGNRAVEFNNIQLPKAPKRATVCALNDVLALDIDVAKK